ncbi:MAG: hypothetical protein ACRD3W_20065 [Terriglobales bacterium]
MGEDDCRILAEASLGDYGAAALPALLQAATSPSPATGRESETSIRKRRSALGLLIEIGLPREWWSLLRHLVSDPELRIAVLACKLSICIAPEDELPRSIRHLTALLENADWRLKNEVEKCLALITARQVSSCCARTSSASN